MYPTFPVAWPAVTSWGIAVPWSENRCLHCFGTSHYCRKIVDLKPKQDTVAVRPIARIADRTVVVIEIKSV